MVDMTVGLEVTFLPLHAEAILNVNSYLCNRMVKRITDDVSVNRSCGTASDSA